MLFILSGWIAQSVGAQGLKAQFPSGIVKKRATLCDRDTEAQSNPRQRGRYTTSVTRKLWKRLIKSQNALDSMWNKNILAYSSQPADIYIEEAFTDATSI